MDYTQFSHVRLTPFEQWVQAEGLKVITTHTVPDVLTVELEPWKRTACLGALLDMTQEPSDEVMINNQDHAAAQADTATRPKPPGNQPSRARLSPTSRVAMASPWA